MTITAIVAISVISTLTTLALSLVAAKRLLRWQWTKGPHTRGLLSSYLDPLEHVERFLHLDSEQLILWNPLKKEIMESKHDLAAYRDALNSADDVEQAINRWEDFVNDSLIVLRKLKPKLIDFYHSLNSEQQDRINTMLSRRFSVNKRCGYNR